MKGLVILWLLLNVASAILNLVMPAAQFSIRSGITLYYSVGGSAGGGSSYCHACIGV